MKEYINIGKIVATFGVKGEMVLLHSLNKKLVFTKIQALFVEQVKGSYIPFFVVLSKAKSMEESFIMLDGITTKEQANQLVTKQVWLLEADFRKLAGTSSPISLLNYHLFNDGVLIGMVEEVIEQPHQVLLKTTYKTKEALIPLHDQTLTKIDRKNNEVHVTLPDGLLEIYAE